MTAQTPGIGMMPPALASRPFAAAPAGQKATAATQAMAAETGSAPQAQGAAASSGFAGGDFETFLKMLTTQIKNQDPLNPMEGSDFAVQLATFSGVEQQVRTNQLLEALAGAQAGGLGAMAGWLGREVRTMAPVAFDGIRPVTLDIQPVAGATRVELVTMDAQGREVLRESIGTGAGEVDWVGRDAAGNPLPAGRYSFKLVSRRGEDTLGTASVGAYARVLGAEATASGVRLTLPGGASTLESQVTAIREPASAS